MAKEVFLKVTGQVQGISFRAWAKKIADQLEIKGYVKNEPDGSVVIIAQGGNKALQKLEEWCWQGSPRAQVENVSKEKRQSKISYKDFQIEY